MADISYSAVVLDENSRNLLIKIFKPMIPNDWEIVAHHMTIKLGELEEDSEPKKDLLEDKTIELEVTDYAYNDKVFAVGVTGYISYNPKPHITIAVNRKEGGKPYMSKFLDNWTPLKFELKLTGKVREFAFN